jgi:hypothetical protein
LLDSVISNHDVVSLASKKAGLGRQDEAKQSQAMQKLKSFIRKKGSKITVCLISKFKAWDFQFEHSHAVLFLVICDQTV